MFKVIEDDITRGCGGLNFLSSFQIKLSVHSNNRCSNVFQKHCNNQKKACFLF